MTFAVRFKASAAKELESLPTAAQARIVDAIKLLAVNPFSRVLPIRKMEASVAHDRFRLRVGDYRVVYEVERNEVVIYIVRVGHRKDVHR
jgi:mRNA interferase RelE/StbE